MKLTDQEFENEKRYQGLMYFVRKMLDEGIITKAEYLSICSDYAGRLSPKTGNLLPMNGLLCTPDRVMNEEKKAETGKIITEQE